MAIKRPREDDQGPLGEIVPEFDHQSDQETDDATAYSTVQVKWGSLCQNQLLRDEIQERVRVMKQVQIEGWHVANFHVPRCFENNIKLPRITTTFFLRCCTGVLLPEEDKSPRACKDNDLNDTLLLYRAHRISVSSEYTAPWMRNAGHSLNVLRKAMSVNAINHIVLNFDRRHFRYITFRYDKDEREARTMIWSCCRKEGDFTPEETEVRKWLKFPPKEVFVKNNLAHFLRKSYETLMVMDVTVGDSDLERLSNFLPASSINIFRP